MADKIRTRFAPSPTGFLHIGGLRSALYAYALAKHSGGTFIFRIEDTDKKREVKGATEAFQVTLKKFGLTWDEFYIQSERHKSGIYVNAALKLVADRHAFYCQCKPKNSKLEGYRPDLRDPCRNKGYLSGAIKLKVPDGLKVSYYDFVHRKEISWNTDTIYDATLLKSDGFPTYNLAAMVDDLDMKITHILRGHDWLPSTPIHLLVFDYLGGKRPEIGHLSDILNAKTGKKLSKRRDSVFCEQFLEEGFLAEAILNFVMLLGWAPKDNRELYSLEEFVKEFDPNGFQDSNPRFLEDKLVWFNGYYIRKSSDYELGKLLAFFAPKNASQSNIEKTVPLIKDRIKKLSEYQTMAGFFFVRPKVNKNLFGEEYKEHLKVAYQVLEKVDKWSKKSIDDVLLTAIAHNKFNTGNFFMSLRICFSGAKITPPMSESMVILGKKEVLARIKLILR